MKKIFTLMMLLVAIVTNAWADDIVWTFTSSDIKDGASFTGSGTNTFIASDGTSELIVKTNSSTNDKLNTVSYSIDDTSYTSELVLNGKTSSSRYIKLPKISGDGTVTVVTGNTGSTRSLYLGTSAGESGTLIKESAAKKTAHSLEVKDLDDTKDYYINIASGGYSLVSIIWSPSSTPKTTTKVNAASTNAFVACNANASPALSSTAATEVTFKDSGTDVFKLSGSIKNGSNDWTLSESEPTDGTYRWTKCSTSVDYELTPVSGITINSAVLYVTSNGSSACTVIYKSGESETEQETGTNSATAPTKITLGKNDSGNFYFKFKAGSAGEARLFVKVNYTTTESIDVKVSSAGYATLFYDKKLAIPTGVTAYTATVSGSSIALTEVENVIPAETGVILEASAGTYNFLVTTADAPTVGSNILTGTTTGTTVTASTVYTLGQNNSNVVGLRLYSGTDIRAYSAYATGLSLAHEFYGFNTDDSVTGIQNIKTGKEDNVYYDLSGHRVLYPTKGLYIVNGKKVIIK